MLMFVGVLAFGLQSCKHDEEVPGDDGSTKTKTEMLTTGKWLMESGTITPSIEVDIFGTKVTISNYWQLLAAINGTTDAEPCVKDNLMIFNTDSTLILDEGATKCDPADPQQEDGGNWMFKENETKITFSAFPYDPLKEERTMKIISLTDSKMVLEMNYDFTDPVTMGTTSHLIELNFKKQ